ncbi:alpha-ketoglutarate-dependent dioxygenase AlkB family protein [Litoribrevibacter euphylliae]|uniref:Alpha-ketoglutarate-dependent dioxygenase AlkB family protein n=1 Tax=Litoribrevibacter euphylliae TaxID=1834034 RepID=A0ABV7HES5_9GAMM
MEPNLIIIENFVKESDSLFLNLKESVNWDERMKARKTASFGVAYDYSGITYPNEDMPQVLGAICEKIDEELGFKPNNCLLNYYLDGDSSMGYHSDSSEELLEGTGVAIVSLGSERNISYRSKEDKEIKHKYPLKSGALLYMNDEVQEKWMHAIPKQKGVGERISLTFRHIIK